MALRKMLSNVSGSQKSKTAAAEPKMHVSQFVCMIESKCQRHYHVFEDGQLNGTKVMLSDVSRSRKSEMADVEQENEFQNQNVIE